MSKFKNTHKFSRNVFMQLFNDDGDKGDNGGQGAGDQGDAGKGGSGEPEQPKMVTMTQEDYDKSIQKRLDRGKNSWEKEFKESEDFKNFQAHMEGQKSESEKLQEKLKGMDTVKQQNEELSSKLRSYEQKSLLTKAETNDEFVDFVLYEVQKTMKDGDEFESALEAFKKVDSNAKYFGSQQQQQQSFRQGQRHSGKGNGEGSTAANLISKMYGDKK